MSRRSRRVHAWATLFRQLADGQVSGLPMPELIALLKRSSSAAPVCGSLLDDLARSSLGELAMHEAIARQRDLQPCVGLIAEAERLGLLAPAFDLLANDWEDQDSWIRELVHLLTWPAILVVTLFLLMVVLMVLVVPAFKEVFTSFGGELPGPTLMVIAISEVWVNHWAPALLIVGVGGWAIWRRRHQVMRSQWLDRALRRLHWLRAVIEGRFHARMGRMALLSAESGLPLATVVHYLRDSTPLHGLAQDASRIAQALDAGLPPSEALHQNLPALGDLAVALAIAEHSGQRGSAMLRVVLALEHELRMRRARLDRTVTLVTYGVVGTVLGTIVIAMYLPIFKLGAVV